MVGCLCFQRIDFGQKFIDIVYAASFPIAKKLSGFTYREGEVAYAEFISVKKEFPFLRTEEGKRIWGIEGYSVVWKFESERL